MKIEVVREQHEAPEYVKAALLRAGGTNRFGQPNYRLVWGWSRLDWIGGQWSDFDASGNLVRRVIELRYVPKYSSLNRWHLESWLPPEAYGSPRMFRLTTMEVVDGRAVSALGPYPQFGEYEHSLTLDAPCAICVRHKREGDCEHRTFVGPTIEIAERLAGAIRFGRSFKEREKAAAIDRRIAYEALQDDKAIDEILGMDPVQIPRARQKYLERVIAPKLDRQIAEAHRLKARGLVSPTGYKISADTPKLAIFKK